MTTDVKSGSQGWCIHTGERDSFQIGDVRVGVADRMDDPQQPGVEFTFVVEDWRGINKVSQGFLEGPGHVEDPFFCVDIDSVEITR